MDENPECDPGALPGVHVTVDQVVAINLRYWRLQSQITQGRLGTITGLSKANISALERSADGESGPRRFDAQAIMNFACALGLPLAALFLPPPDDGISRRYLFHAGDGACHDMASLASYAISDPPDSDASALAKQYEERYKAMIRRYTELDDSEPDGWRGDLASAERRRMELERIQERRTVLAELIAQMDRRADAISGAGGVA